MQHCALLYTLLLLKGQYHRDEGRGLATPNCRLESGILKQAPTGCLQLCDQAFTSLGSKDHNVAGTSAQRVLTAKC